MRKYWSFFRIRFIAGLQYRAAALAGICTQFFWGTMTLLLYRAFYQNGGSAFPMTFPELSCYIWLQQASLGMFMAWSFDEDIFSGILSGGVSYELCRPADLYAMWFTKNMALRMSRTALRCLPILLVAAFLPEPFRLLPPPVLFCFLGFVVSLLLGFLVLVAFSMLVYISVFYTLSTSGVRILVVSVVEFFSGFVIPLPFFPEALQPFVRALPFASMQSTPFLVYSGNLSGGELAGAVGMQAVWLIVLLVFGRLWMAKTLKRVVVQGG